MATVAINLENLRKQAVVLNLPYQTAGDVSLCCRQEVGRIVIDRQSGQKALKLEKRKLSGSLSLRPKGKAGSKAYGLPPGVERCPDVQAGLRGGWLRCQHLDAEELKLQEKAIGEAEYAAEMAKKHAAEMAKRKAAKRAAQSQQAMEPDESNKKPESSGGEAPKPSRRRAAESRGGDK